MHVACCVIVFGLDVTGGSVVLNRYDHAKESHQWYLVGGTIRNRYNKEQVIDNPAHATAGIIGYAAFKKKHLFKFLCHHHVLLRATLL